MITGSNNSGHGFHMGECLEESSNIFDKLKVRKDEIPIKPLTEGKLE